MTEERMAFVRACVFNHNDNAPRLVYIDWLIENGLECETMISWLTHEITFDNMFIDGHVWVCDDEYAGSYLEFNIMEAYKIAVASYERYLMKPIEEMNEYFTPDDNPF